MQKLTKLKLSEFEEKVRYEMSEKWTKTKNKLAANGLLGSGHHLETIMKIGNECVEKYYKDLIDVEKLALSKKPSECSEEYFELLKEEMIAFVAPKFDAINSHAQSMCPNDQQIRTRFEYLVQQSQETMINSVKRDIDILKEEFNIGLHDQPNETTVNVGGDVAVLNIGQIKGNIEANLKNIENSVPQEVIEALLKIADACNQSNISEVEKRRQLETIEFLVKQCTVDETSVSGGVINSLVMSLSSAANLTTIWVQYGPAISKFFGL